MPLLACRAAHWAWPAAATLALLVTARSAPRPQAGEALEVRVTSPRPWQVFQRRTRERGEILLRGELGVACQRLEARVAGGEVSGPLATWHALDLRDQRGFDARLPLEAGGWYRLELRARTAAGGRARWAVEPFGVGEVFVGAGQSNSTNCGEARTRSTSGRVATFDGRTWRRADDPQPGTHDGTQGGSFWPAFGDALAQRFDVPVGVASTGHTGSSIVRWEPDGPLFAWTLERVRALGPRGLRALLWHQGEADHAMPGEEYERRLERIIAACSEQAGWEVPWFVAQVSYRSPQTPQHDGLRAAQDRLWRRGVALRGPDTDALRGPHRDHDGQGIHFSAQGLRAHGELWAQRVGDWLEDELAP